MLAFVTYKICGLMGILDQNKEISISIKIKDASQDFLHSWSNKALLGIMAHSNYIKACRDRLTLLSKELRFKVKSLHHLSFKNKNSCKSDFPTIKAKSLECMPHSNGEYLPNILDLFAIESMIIRFCPSLQPKEYLSTRINNQKYHKNNLNN